MHIIIIIYLYLGSARISVGQMARSHEPFQRPQCHSQAEPPQLGLSNTDETVSSKRLSVAVYIPLQNLCFPNVFSRIRPDTNISSE